MIFSEQTETWKLKNYKSFHFNAPNISVCQVNIKN